MSFFDKIAKSIKDAGGFGAVADKAGSFIGQASPFVSMGLGIAQAVKGAKDASRYAQAKRDLINNRQELSNITEGMRVSTLGAEMQTQEAQRRFATSVDALQAGGVRGVVGGLAQQEQMQQRLQQGISADLDRQQAQIEQMRAQDEGRIRQMKESREEFKIGALAGEEEAARTRAAMGMKSLSSGMKSLQPLPETPTSRDQNLIKIIEQLINKQ